MEKKWSNYIEDEKTRLFNERYDEMTKKFIEKYDLVKGMKITNKIEGDVISDEKINTMQVLSDVQQGNIKASDGKKMIEWNGTLTSVFEKNPFVLDYIIL